MDFLISRKEIGIIISFLRVFSNYLTISAHLNSLSLFSIQEWSFFLRYCSFSSRVALNGYYSFDNWSYPSQATYHFLELHFRELHSLWGKNYPNEVFYLLLNICWLNSIIPNFKPPTGRAIKYLFSLVRILLNNYSLLHE